MQACRKVKMPAQLQGDDEKSRNSNEFLRLDQSILRLLPPLFAASVELSVGRMK
jgi:hypothetical protein